jgi:hypothetical protein
MDCNGPEYQNGKLNGRDLHGGIAILGKYYLMSDVGVSIDEKG